MNALFERKSKFLLGKLHGAIAQNKLPDLSTQEAPRQQYGHFRQAFMRGHEDGVGRAGFHGASPEVLGSTVIAFDGYLPETRERNS
jgi:hypothetical protein